jgi:hypothetical protein
VPLRVSSRVQAISPAPGRRRSAAVISRGHRGRWRPFSEPGRLIGSAGHVDRPWIPRVSKAVTEVAPRALVMHGGGIADPSDVLYVMSQGADGTGSTSSVVFAEDRPAAARSLIHAVRLGWDRRAAQCAASA